MATGKLIAVNLSGWTWSTPPVTIDDSITELTEAHALGFREGYDHAMGRVAREASQDRV